MHEGQRQGKYIYTYIYNIPWHTRTCAAIHSSIWEHTTYTSYLSLSLTHTTHTHTHTYKCTLSISCTDRHTYTLHAWAPKDFSVNKSYQCHRHQTLSLPYIVITGLVDWVQDIKLVTDLLITGAYYRQPHTHTKKLHDVLSNEKATLDSPPHPHPPLPTTKIQKQKPIF